ncbi:hypothetical protein BDZ97DRAFT_1887065 [Flammula alnicola]|nr:hypothetical protein BDZ97DRAFT_1887065 [Flammula alnicola]
MYDKRIVLMAQRLLFAGSEASSTLSGGVQVSAEWRRVQVAKDAMDVRGVAFAAVAILPSSFASSGGGTGGIELWFASAGASANALYSRPCTGT